MTNASIKEKLLSVFGDKVFAFAESYGMLEFYIHTEDNIAILKELYDNDEFAFRFLTDVTAVHYPDSKGKEFVVVYHLHNLVKNFRVRIKAELDINNPNIQSATAIFESANWQERETYDFFGINFVNHPNLRRILNADEMDYFPMRKEYPLEDQTRLDKDNAMFGR